MKKSILQIVLILFLCAGAFNSYSQSGPDPDDPGLPGDGDDIDGEDVPLDGGVMILMAAGAAYGYHKLKEDHRAGSSQPG
ncbi:MAG TPA: hypothetical protein VGE15_10065 [Sphingobacteriaceae bacterium]